MKRRVTMLQIARNAFSQCSCDLTDLVKESFLLFWNAVKRTYIATFSLRTCSNLPDRSMRCPLDFQQCCSIVMLLSVPYKSIEVSGIVIQSIKYSSRPTSHVPAVPLWYSAPASLFPQLCNATVDGNEKINNWNCRISPRYVMHSKMQTGSIEEFRWTT